MKNESPKDAEEYCQECSSTTLTIYIYIYFQVSKCFIYFGFVIDKAAPFDGGIMVG